jgi:WD40 repeat protein
VPRRLLYLGGAVAVFLAWVVAQVVTGTASPVRPHAAPGSLPPAATGVAATLTAPEPIDPTWLAFSPHGTLLAAGGTTSMNTTDVWSTAGSGIVATLKDPPDSGPQGQYGELAGAFSPDGALLATANNNGRVYLWSASTWRLVATLTAPGSRNFNPSDLDSPGTGVSDVAFSPNGKILATADNDGRSYLWDPATGRLLATLIPPGNAGVLQVAFSPDGKTLATSGLNGTDLWDTGTDRLVGTLTDQGYAVWAIAFSRSGAMLATADDNNCYLWDVAMRQETATLPSPNPVPPVPSNVAMARWASFSPDGKTLAIIYNYLYVWDVATGRLTSSLSQPGGGQIYAAAFSPVGNILATSGAPGTAVYLWHVS